MNVCWERNVRRDKTKLHQDGLIMKVWQGVIINLFLHETKKIKVREGDPTQLTSCAFSHARTKNGCLDNVEVVWMK